RGRIVARDLGDHALPLAQGQPGGVEGEPAVGRHHARVVRLERERVAGAAHAPGQLGAAALDHLLDLPLRALVAGPGRQAHAVAVERAAAEARGHEYVVGAVVALDEAEAGRVDADAPDDAGGRGGGLPGQAEASARGLLHAAGGDELGDELAQAVAG